MSVFVQGIPCRSDARLFVDKLTTQCLALTVDDWTYDGFNGSVDACL